MVTLKASAESDVLMRSSYGDDGPGRSLPADHGQRSVDGQKRAQSQGKFIGRPKGSKNKRE